MDVTNIVAVNAKRIREQKKLTLDAAAAVTGVSRSMLAQIEKGEVNPTISVLWKIANGYKVYFTALIENKSDTVSVVKKDDITTVRENDKYMIYPLFPFDEDKLFEIYRVLIEADGGLYAQPHLKGSEEYITVYAGEVEIVVGDDSYTLSGGDSIRFAADVTHAYKNIGSELVELNMIIYYNKVD